MEQSILYDVADAKLFGVTAAGDDATVPTYGDAVDVPGINSVELSPNFESNSAYGDGRTMDTRTKLSNLGLSFEYVKLSPAVLAVVDGGAAVTNAGVTEYRRRADDKVPYFGFAGLVTETDEPEGTALLVVAYAKVNGGTLFGSAGNAYGEPSFEADAVYTPSGFLWKARLSTAGETLPTTGAAFATLLEDLAAPA